MDKRIKIPRTLKEYAAEEQLIEGAYKIGAIDAKTRNTLRGAKKTFDIFNEPAVINKSLETKVDKMMKDCITYVLRQKLPVDVMQDIVSFRKPRYF